MHCPPSRPTFYVEHLLVMHIATCDSFLSLICMTYWAWNKQSIKYWVFIFFEYITVMLCEVLFSNWIKHTNGIRNFSKDLVNTRCSAYKIFNFHWRHLTIESFKSFQRYHRCRLNKTTIMIYVINKINNSWCMYW